MKISEAIQVEIVEEKTTFICGFCLFWESLKPNEIDINGFDLWFINSWIYVAGMRRKISSFMSNEKENFLRWILSKTSETVVPRLTTLECWDKTGYKWSYFYEFFYDYICILIGIIRSLYFTYLRKLIMIREKEKLSKLVVIKKANFGEFSVHKSNNVWGFWYLIFLLFFWDVNSSMWCGNNMSELWWKLMLVSAWLLKPRKEVKHRSSVRLVRITCDFSNPCWGKNLLWCYRWES